jgi:hypothetical protein
MVPFIVWANLPVIPVKFLYLVLLAIIFYLNTRFFFGDKEIPLITREYNALPTDKKRFYGKISVLILLESIFMPVAIGLLSKWDEIVRDLQKAF